MTPSALVLAETLVGGPGFVNGVISPEVAELDVPIEFVAVKLITYDTPGVNPVKYVENTFAATFAVVLGGVDDIVYPVIGSPPPVTAGVHATRILPLLLEAVKPLGLLGTV